MMTLTQNIIDKYEDTHEYFGYYKSIIHEIEVNQSSNPDISIESCKSLIEGVSKSILMRLNKSMTEKRVNDYDAHDIFKVCCNYLGQNQPLEIEFTRQGYNLVKRIAELRNERGDISHGKASPKSVLSAKESARMIIGVTDSIVHYLLVHFFKTDLSSQDEIGYEENEGFNLYLDESYPELGLSYSMALFDQDPVAYEEQLRDYKDDLGIEDE